MALSTSRQITILRLISMAALIVGLGLIVAAGYFRHRAAKTTQALKQSRAQHRSVKRVQKRLKSLRRLLADINTRYENALNVTGLNRTVLPTPPDDLQLRLAGKPRPHDTYRTFISRLDAHRRQIGRINEFVRHRRVVMQHIPTRIPVRGWLSSEFGPRRAPMDGRGDGYHTGVDLASWVGRPVWAPANGVVVETGHDRLYGQFVVLKHQFGYKTRLAHLRSRSVEQGQPVRRGQVVGQVGSTGHSTGAHLHYEILINDRPVDPQPYLLALPESARNTP